MYISLNLFQTIPASSWLSAKNNPVAPNNQTDRRSLTPPPLQDLLWQGLQLSHVLDVIWMFTPICHLCLGHHGYNGGVYIGWLGKIIEVYKQWMFPSQPDHSNWAAWGAQPHRVLDLGATLLHCGTFGNDRGTKRGCGEKETWKAKHAYVQPQTYPKNDKMLEQNGINI